MPYVTREKRAAIIQHVDYLWQHIATVGELNFAITLLLHREVGGHGLSYKTLNMLVGVLESIKAEFQRMVVGPYEEQKRKQNGPVSNWDRDLPILKPVITKDAECSTSDELPAG